MSGGNGHEEAATDRHLIAHLRRLAGPARRVASVCTGATLLAAAGLLDGRRATTHWHYAGSLARGYPKVTVDADPIFIRDGRVATSGGVTAALDLTLSFVEEDHGADLARRVALGLVTYMQRPGNQAQMTLFTTARRADDATVRAVVEHAVAHPDADLGTDAMARRAGVSTRQLTRLFVAELGDPPATVVRRIRLEAAGSCCGPPTCRCRRSPTAAASRRPRRCGRRSSRATRSHRRGSGRPRRPGPADQPVMAGRRSSAVDAVSTAVAFRNQRISHPRSPIRASSAGGPPDAMIIGVIGTKT